MYFLLLSVFPFILWYATEGFWHVVIAVVYAVLAVTIVTLYIQGFRRQLALDRANPITWATPKWAPRVSPATFAQQLSMSVQLQGWRVVSSAPDDRGRVALIAKKDRWTVALLCIDPDQTSVTGADEDRLASMRWENGASHAALVTARHVPSAGLFERTTLQFDDLERLEDAMGLRS